MARQEASVRVKHGALRGRLEASEDGSLFYCFQGVPYAKPPVGPLRFKPPQPLEQWEEVRDAVKEGPPCPQIEWILKLPYRGDEDCLYLNVYTPQLPKGDEKPKIPVMVWIHGGGFEVGCGDAFMYGPHYLVNEGIILVTINYRLGILGFLSVDETSSTRNLGLKDQVAALRWVKENIEVFGGDPNNVTIFGESAGSASVHFHMLSPLSKGLFHKAILESGCALNGWALSDNTNALAFAVGKELGYTTTDAKELLTFLEGVPARELVEEYMNTSKNKQVNGRQWHFGPTIENYDLAEEIFLPDHPRELMIKRKWNNIPCMIGMNSQEGIFFASIIGVLKNPTVLKYIGENFETQVPYGMDFRRNRSEVAREIKKFYFDGEDLSETSLNAYIDFASDAWFLKGIHETVNTLAEKSSQVYYYCFDFSGKMNIYKNFVQADDFTGASHLDELGYLFTTPFFSTPKAEPGSPEWTTLRRMTRMWTDFAKSGNPTPQCDEIIDIEWRPYSSENPVCLNISDQLYLQRNQYKNRMDFWDNL